MVNFYPIFITCNDTASITNVAGEYKPPSAIRALRDIFSEHINHIRAVAGVDHVGLGAGFDGIN
jgi:microsomal dipeptidase-like Zn-dependent dipeptidase